jgi:hypothetical protein
MAINDVTITGPNQTAVVLRRIVNARMQAFHEVSCICKSNCCVFFAGNSGKNVEKVEVRKLWVLGFT